MDVLAVVVITVAAVFSEVRNDSTPHMSSGKLGKEAVWKTVLSIATVGVLH